MLTDRTVRSSEEALVFVTECSLATAYHLAGLSRPPKAELQRQVSIAQTGVTWIRPMEGVRLTPRVAEVLAAGGDVSAWLRRKRAGGSRGETG